MAERFPTKEQWDELRKMSQENLRAAGSMVTVHVYKNTVSINVDGCNVFHATAWQQIQVQTSINMPEETGNA